MERGTSDGQTIVERRSDREVVVTRMFDAPPGLVFEAWTRPELFRQWWVPKSSGMALVSCEMDVRVGGGYRLEFRHPGAERTMAFFGKYREVVPGLKLVWTNDEGPDGAVTTVTFTEKDGKTLLVLSELYPTKEALDASLEGMEEGMPEQFEQLDQFLDARSAKA